MMQNDNQLATRQVSLLSIFLHGSNMDAPPAFPQPCAPFLFPFPLAPLVSHTGMGMQGGMGHIMQNPREESTAHIGIIAADHTSRFKYVYTQISVLDEHTKVLKGNIVNRALPSLHGVHGGSPKITLTVYLRKFSARMFT